MLKNKNIAAAVFVISGFLSLLGCGGHSSDNSGNTVQFSDVNYTVSETDSSIVITVDRGGDGAGSASVDYHTADQTATAGSDYRAVSGALVWEDGETGPKTFSLPIYADTVADPDETLSLSLDNPNGNIILGSQASSTVTIGDKSCTSLLDKSITADTTLSDECYLVTADIMVTNSAVLTIKPGVILLFQAGAGLVIPQGSALKALGNETKPITFTGEQKTAGYWSGIHFSESDNSNNRLDHVVVEFAGSRAGFPADISIHGTNALPVRVRISNSVISDSSTYGFYFNANSIIDDFSNNTVTRNESGAGEVSGNAVGMLDATTSYVGNSNDVVLVDKSNIDVAQTWHAIDAPYLLEDYDYFVNTQQTIEAGAKLVFQAQGGLTIAQNGALNAVGTADKPIVFTAEQQTPGYWLGINFFQTNNVNNQLDYVTVEYGGARDLLPANVSVESTSTSSAKVKISNSTLSNSSGYGFYFDPGSIVDGFSNNTVTKNAEGAGYIYGNMVGMLDSGTSYAGNTKDIVFVDFTDSDTIENNQTWHAIDASYLLTGVDFNIYAPQTIEAGATLEFQANGGMRIAPQGALTAVGTADKPIVFTGEQKTAGYWQGIHFSQSNNNVLDFVKVEFGGSRLSYLANISLNGTPTLPSKANITNCTIQNSQHYGIWVHTGAVVNDVQKDNTFNNNPDGNVIQ